MEILIVIGLIVGIIWFFSRKERQDRENTISENIPDIPLLSSKIALHCMDKHIEFIDVEPPYERKIRTFSWIYGYYKVHESLGTTPEVLAHDTYNAVRDFLLPQGLDIIARYNFSHMVIYATEIILQNQFSRNLRENERGLITSTVLKLVPPYMG
ncbi:hypothetical protein F4X33_12460 [Candidatus Poribacteria bacterium]|nr:hypothetical protein [Candidatus Poribacteria bacterium]